LKRFGGAMCFDIPAIDLADCSGDSCKANRGTFTSFHTSVHPILNRTIIFRGLPSRDFAGTVYSSSSAAPYYDDCNFSNCQAAYSGAGIYGTIATSANWSVSFCQFHHGSGGEAVTNGGLWVAITDSIFLNNTILRTSPALENLSLLYHYDKTGGMLVTSCSFFWNQSPFNKGSVLLIVLNCKFVPSIPEFIYTETGSRKCTGNTVVDDSSLAPIVETRQSWSMSCVPSVSWGPTRSPVVGSVTRIRVPFRARLELKDTGSYQFIACQWIECTVQGNGGGLYINITGGWALVQECSFGRCDA
jgi:hypothetical protein